VNNIVIIGSGFSAFATYLKFRKYNPTVISSTKNTGSNLVLNNRNKLKINKPFSTKSLSYGNFTFNLKNNTRLHDRLSLGGNSNIWGGFININLLPINFINNIKNLGIFLHKLDQKKNGYLSNENGLRQLRDSDDKILDVSKFFNQYIEGFVDSFDFKNKLIKIKYYSEKKKIIETISASKLFIAISFPQLIDILYRSNMVKTDLKLQLDEYEHNFQINTRKIISNNNSLIIKYDFIRILKHYFGYQKSIDNFPLNLPLFVDQEFSNSKRFLNLNVNINNKIISQISSQKFGDSIHYCNLYIEEQKISKYISNFLPNVFGVSMPFVSQEKPGPIANDIINNIWKNY